MLGTLLLVSALSILILPYIATLLLLRYKCNVLQVTASPGLFFIHLICSLLTFVVSGALIFVIDRFAFFFTPALYFILVNIPLSLAIHKTYKITKEQTAMIAKATSGIHLIILGIFLLVLVYIIGPGLRNW